MEKITIKQFAEDIGISSERLREQLVEVGLSDKSAEDIISEQEKAALLRFLRGKHGKKEEIEPKKIVLKRKKTSKIKIPVKPLQGGGRAKPRLKTVNVEFRRHHTYAKRSALIEDINREREAAERERALKIKAETEIAEKEAAAAKEATAAKEAAIAEQEKIKAIELKNKADAIEPLTEEKIAVPTDETASEKHQQAAPIQQKEATTDAAQTKKPAAEKLKQPKAAPKHAQNRSKLHVASEKSGRRKKKTTWMRSAAVRSSSKQHSFEKPVAPVVHEVEIPEYITAAELARRMSIKATEVIKVMMKLGCMANINQNLDQDTAVIVVEEMGHQAKILRSNVLEEEIGQLSERQGEGVARAPVVTIMGHVDHGKTSLLDYIRRSRVAATEKGEITQHIGAYRVATDNGDITFLDTPGHQAFTAMRARGTKITDIVVIVVAADDGVMPQTEEAITHAKAASVAVIVAINKIDKEGVDPERVKQELSKHELIPEDWGGDTLFIPVSAKTGQGVDKLLDSIVLQSEIMELKAVDTGVASGIVIESRLDKGRGPIASILIKHGRLKKGDIILSGHIFGRVRAMINDSGKEITEAGPSTPVEILGLSSVPNAGDEIVVVSSERKAKEIAALRQSKYRDLQIVKQQSKTTKDFFSKMDDSGKKSLNLLIKADVQGSAEAIAMALKQLDKEEVIVNIVSSSVGGITESDINLALASQGFIIGFNVRADSAARKLVNAEGIDLHYYSIIYDVIDDVKKLVEGMIAPKMREQIIGVAEVHDIFRSPKFGDIAGCLVTSGAIKRNSEIRVLRENTVIYQGILESLRHFKDDVDKIQSGMECGIGVKNYNDIKVGDQIEVFESVEVKR